MALVLASGVSLVVVLSSPFVAQVRSVMSDVFPESFSLVVNAGVAAAAGLALGFGFRRMRHRRALRVGLLGGALALAATYMLAAGTGNAEVDAVERFHFVEYGLVTWLFYRGFRSRGDASILVLPVCAALLVGTFDEWMQWFVPDRVGELGDLLLNLTATACGLLVSLGWHPPARFPTGLVPGSVVRIGLLLATTLLGVAAFVQSVHMGYRIDAPAIGGFDSRYTRDTLARLSADRELLWVSRPPLPAAALSREDQYLSEALWHIRARNAAWDDDDIAAAWRENLILERYYAPALDVMTGVSGNTFRWSAEQRADAAARGQTEAFFLSDAPPIAIVTWPRLWFWLAVIATLYAMVLLSIAVERKVRRPSTAETSD